jgi:hypothetical protein
MESEKLIAKFTTDKCDEPRLKEPGKEKAIN